MAPTTTKSATKAKPAAATAGVAKKRGPGAKRANAKNAMIKMQAYCELRPLRLPQLPWTRSSRVPTPTNATGTLVAII